MCVNVGACVSKQPLEIRQQFSGGHFLPPHHESQGLD